MNRLKEVYQEVFLGLQILFNRFLIVTITTKFYFSDSFRHLNHLTGVVNMNTKTFYEKCRDSIHYFREVLYKTLLLNSLPIPRDV